MRTQTTPGESQKNKLGRGGSRHADIHTDEWPRPGPYLTLVRGSLVFNKAAWDQDRAFVRPGPWLLEGFLALAHPTTSIDHVLTYARGWGLLDLCHHQLPMGHRMADLPTSLAQATDTFLVLAEPCESLAGDESLHTWSYWARQAQAILSISDGLSRGVTTAPQHVISLFERAPWVPVEPPRTEEWEELPERRVVGVPIEYEVAAVDQSRTDALESVRRQPLGPDQLRGLVRSTLDFWVDMSNVRLSLRWINGRPDFAWTGGLFAALGMQMLMAIAGSRGFTICANCGDVHVPSRPNSKNRDSFCAPCRADGAPARKAQQRYQALGPVDARPGHAS